LWIDNTGGVLFKIYIVGETIKVVRRFSLPNISKRELSKVAGVFRFPRVSCAAASADDADLDPNIAGKWNIFFKTNTIYYPFYFQFLVYAKGVLIYDMDVSLKLCKGQVNG